MVNQVAYRIKLCLGELVIRPKGALLATQTPQEVMRTQLSLTYGQGAANRLPELIRRVDQVGNDFWRPRELAKVLENSWYRHFGRVVERASNEHQNLDFVVANCFESLADFKRMAMPEDLPVAGSIKKIEHKAKKLNKGK